MKIAFITMHAARNYGAVLQTYALQKVLNQMGHESIVIDYRRNNQKLFGYLFYVNEKFRKNFILSTAFVFKMIVPKIKTSILFSKFLSRKIHLSCKITKAKNVEKKIHADIYCVGSDQVWNPKANNGFDKMYFLNGCKAKKISYASSVGVYDLNAEDLNVLGDFLSQFSSVSIRESSSIPLLQKKNIAATCVLDPTLLINHVEWERFSSNIKVPGDYLLIYFFGNAKDIMDAAVRVAKLRNLRICRISVGYETYSNDDVIFRFISPEQFVSLFSNASFVITNSFHGTAYSVNFSKQFLVYPTTEKNARFDSILQMFHLEDRNIRQLNANQIDDIKDIDYSLIRNELNNQRDKSYQYLFDALAARV